MVGMVGSWRTWGHRTLMAWGVVVGITTAATLSGCAAQPELGAGRDSSAGTFTASDEPEARRRARIRLELAANYFEMGQTTVALDEVKQAINADPSYSDAYNLRGLVHMQLGEFPQAEESFRRALSLRPGDSNILHNHGWLLCQQKKFGEADQQFVRALASPTYTARAKTFMAQGLCQAGAGNFSDAEQSLGKAYELDAGNPVIGYNLASLLFRRNELTRAQFLIRRLNNSQLANAETLWLGVKIERAVGDTVAMRQLADQLRRRFPDSKEHLAYERGAFHE